MAKKTTKPPLPPEVVWLYDVLDMMCGLSYCIYDRMTMQLVRDNGGALHFSTVKAATDHAVKLAKRHKYEDLIREVPWR